MIHEKGYYKDQFDRIWYWDGWSNQPTVSLKMLDKYIELGFYRDGNPMGSEQITKIVEYLSPEKYPEYYI